MAEHKKFGYEKADVHLPAIVKNLIALFVLLTVAMVAMWWFFKIYRNWRASNDAPLPPMANVNQVPPDPRLEIREGEVVDATRAYDQPLITGYAWVDEKAGIVQIPVKRAMELYVQQKSHE